MAALKRRGKKTFLITAVCILAFATAVHFLGTNPLSKVLKTIFEPVQHGFAYISYRADKFKNFLWEMDEYKKQNDELIKRVDELEKQNKDAAQYRNENEQLQSILELKNSINDYTTVAAAVIGYSSESLYETLEINKGSLNGIKKGNSVITDKGIVGTVTETGPNWATVSSILNSDSATGVRVSRTGALGLIEGDASLSKKSLCRLSFVDSVSDIIIGDILETSGSGGIYPPGLSAGRIKEINSDNTGSLEYAEVEPAVDFSDLYAVIVINGMK